MKESFRVRSSECGSFIVDGRGTILGFDEEMEKLTRWPAIEIVGRNKELEGSAGEMRAGTQELGGQPLYSGNISVVEGDKNIELSLNCRDGRVLGVEATVHPLTGPGERMLVNVLRVLTQTSQTSIDRAAKKCDPLTQLPNSRAFASRLTDEFDAAARSARPLALVLADIDHLRDVNDRFGRTTGDEVIRKLAGILRVCVDEENRLARLCEDDFAILMPDAGRGEARQLAASLRSTVERHRFFDPDGGTEQFGVTLSLGAASYPADAESATDLVERAREALTEARSMGRNRVWCYLRRPRVPVHVPVFFDGAESSLVGYSRDLSPSGIFVQTSMPIDIGMRCALTFPLPGHDGKVHVIGKVVRTVPPETAREAQELRIPGMGVEFERFGGRMDRRAIELFLHDNEAKSLRPETGILSV